MESWGEFSIGLVNCFQRGSISRKGRIMRRKNKGSQFTENLGRALLDEIRAQDHSPGGENEPP